MAKRLKQKKKLYMCIHTTNIIACCAFLMIQNSTVLISSLKVVLSLAKAWGSSLTGSRDIVVIKKQCHTFKTVIATHEKVSTKRDARLKIWALQIVHFSKVVLNVRSTF